MRSRQYITLSVVNGEKPWKRGFGNAEYTAMWNIATCANRYKPCVVIKDTLF